MAATAPIPTLPGVTKEQVLQAMEIVSRVYAEAGVLARIEPRHYRDPDVPDSEVVEITAWIESETPFETYRSLVRDVPSTLAKQGLYRPQMPISTHPIPDW